jgi:hypothetical protein
MCSFIWGQQDKSLFTLRGKCNLYLSLKPNSRDKGVVLWGTGGERAIWRRMTAPS